MNALDKVLYRKFQSRSEEDMKEAVEEAREGVCEDCESKEHCLCMGFVDLVKAELLYKNAVRIRSN